MNQEQKWITTGNLIGGLFTFLLCTTGLALAGVFIAKLAANHSQVALTDFLLLALGLTILVIGYKCNFEKFIFHLRRFAENQHSVLPIRPCFIWTYHCHQAICRQNKLLHKKS